MTDYMYGSQEKVVINNSLIDNNSHQLCHSDIGGHVLVEVFFQRNINSCKAFPQERHPDESTRLPTRQPGWEKDRTKKAGTTFGQVETLRFYASWHWKQVQRWKVEPPKAGLFTKTSPGKLCVYLSQLWQLRLSRFAPGYYMPPGYPPGGYPGYAAYGGYAWLGR